MLLLPIALLCLLTALILLALSGRQQRRLGLPGGRIIYADTSRWSKTEKPLFDPQLGLTGRPDYLIEQGDQIIPVEVKSTRAVEAPYDSHIFQLGAYCLLVEHTFGKRPSYGIIHYPNRTFAVDYTPALEDAVLNVIAELHEKSSQKNLPRSHEAPERCAHCGFRNICDQSLRI